MAKTQIGIPYSLADYTATFKRPLFEAWSDREKLAGGLVDAFRGLSPEMPQPDITLHSSEKFFDQSVSIRAGTNLTFRIHPNKCVVSAENPDWSESAKILERIHAGFDVLAEKASAQIAGQNLVLAMHVQLKDRPIKEVTAKLVNPDVARIWGADVASQGCVLYRVKGMIVIDSSSSYANALFVRISRDFDPEVAVDHIADTLLEDEKAIFGCLELEGEL